MLSSFMPSVPNKHYIQSIVMPNVLLLNVIMVSFVAPFVLYGRLILEVIVMCCGSFFRNFDRNMIILLMLAKINLYQLQI
jgi:hypothetical protein